MGRKYPSVTQVLSPWAEYSNVPGNRLEAAAVRGTRVHAACASIALGVPVLRREAGDEGYIASFRSWFSRMVFRVAGVELELADEALGYMGHLDFLFELVPGILPILDPGDLAVIDIKTPVTEQPTWKPQAAAYLNLARRKYPKAKACATLQLDPQGGPAKMNWYLSSPRDFAVFVSALSCWNYFKGGDNG